MDLLDIKDVQVYFDKKKMPYPYCYEIESIASVFPKEKMIFLDYILLDDYMEFYKLFTMCAYEVKAYRLNISITDASTYCNAFVFHMLNVVFNYRMDIDIDDSFMKKLIEITELYPAEKIRKCWMNMHLKWKMMNLNQKKNVYYINIYDSIKR